MTLESACIHRRNGDREESRYEVPILRCGPMSLLGHVVKNADAQADGSLTLLFDDGQVLVFIEDSRQYECYMIKRGTVEIIV